MNNEARATREYTMTELCEISGNGWMATKRLLDTMNKVGKTYTSSTLFFVMSEDDLKTLETADGTKGCAEKLKEKRRKSLLKTMQEDVPANLAEKQKNWLTDLGLIVPEVKTKESYEHIGFMSRDYR